jgi:hypothetical protein
VQSGLIEISDIRDGLRDAAGSGWVKAILGTVGGSPVLQYAEVVVGRKPPGWVARTWTYEDHLFVAARITPLRLARWLSATKQSRAKLGGIDVQVPPVRSPSSSWSRRASKVLSLDASLPWPILEYTISLAGEQMHTHNAFMVGHDGPSFPALSGAYAAFFRDNFKVTGTSDPNWNQLIVRVIDDGAWLSRVHIRPTLIEVRVSGRDAAGAELELNSAGHRAVVRLEAAGLATIPLPDGLPPDAWLWLRRAGNWLDYRALSGWPGSRSADVLIDVPDDPETDIEALISQGEGQHLEFKQQLPGNTFEEKRKVLKTVAAFATAEGGTVIFGVTDDGSPLGLTGDMKEHIDRLSKLLRDLITPAVRYQLTRVELPGRELLQLKVEAGGQLFAFLNRGNRPEYFVRRDGTTFYAKPEELTQLAHSASALKGGCSH